MQELTAIGGNMLSKLSDHLDNQPSQATSRRNSVAQSKNSNSSKSSPKKRQHIVLFFLFWGAMGWTAFYNLIEYLPSSITAQAAQGAYIGTAAAQILIFLGNSWVYSQNWKELIRMHVQVDKLFISFVTVSYSYFNLSISFYAQSQIEHARIALMVIVYFLQVGCVRILCKNVGWRNWQVLILKLLLTAGSASFIYLSKTIKQNLNIGIPNFPEVSTVYVLNQSLYFGLLYNEISKKSAYGDEYAGKFAKALEKIMGYFVVDADDEAGQQETPQEEMDEPSD